MVHNTLQIFLTQPAFAHPVWQRALTWLQKMPKDLPMGEQPIEGRDIYVNHFEVETVSAEAAPYELHQQYIDIHYCITGGERIRFGNAEIMQPTTKYDAEKDYILLKSDVEQQEIKMHPHDIAIFMPNEAHAPKISDGVNAKVNKVVVKIKASLLN